MKNLIKKILREETEEQVLKIPGLRYFGDISTPQDRFVTWNILLKFTNGRKFIILDDLDLRRTRITSLGNLQSVGGYLDLYNTLIKSLGNLQSVGGYLDLNRTPITSLGNLQSVGGHLYLSETPIKSLGNFQSVGGYLDLSKTPLSKKFTEEEIRQMVNIEGNIYLL